MEITIEDKGIGMGKGMGGGSGKGGGSSIGSGEGMGSGIGIGGGISAAWQLPHPPIAVPEVGLGREREIAATAKMFRAAARKIASCGADTVVLISPHAPISRKRGEFLTQADARMFGDLSQFGAPKPLIEYEGDRETARRIVEEAVSAGLSCALSRDHSLSGNAGGDCGLDHGTVVPLRFLEYEYAGNKARRRPKLVVVSTARAGRDALIEFGACIGRAAVACERRVVLITSGDLSHKLKREGPYGFDPAGPAFDRVVLESLRDGDVERLMNVDEELLENAAQCGYYGLLMTFGALGGRSASARVYSYEDIFGVGYAVAEFVLSGSDAPVNPGDEASDPGDPADLANSAAAADPAAPASPADPAAAAACAEPYVALAEAAIRTYATTGLPPDMPSALFEILRGEGAAAQRDDLSAPNAPNAPSVSREPSESSASNVSRESSESGALSALLESRAGAFVSIKKKGELRGCIGTICATRENLAEEIVCNAISACGRDPRFDPVEPEELDELDVSVDILSDAEPVRSLADLDVKRYGVIVSKGYRRGLLLPNLEGVDTVDVQIRIALAKAGIGASEDYSVERFEVARHERR